MGYVESSLYDTYSKNNPNYKDFTDILRGICIHIALIYIFIQYSCYTVYLFYLNLYISNLFINIFVNICRSTILSGRVDSWINTNGSLSTIMTPAWYCLYLATCKLLDLCMTLNAEKLPQFAMYKWAFIGEESDRNNFVPCQPGRSSEAFVPYINRLSTLMNRKFGPSNQYLTAPPGKPALTLKSITSLQELQPFIDYLVRSHSCRFSSNKLSVPLNVSKSKSAPDVRSAPFTLITCDEVVDESLPSEEYIEKLVLMDFLEPMPQ